MSQNDQVSLQFKQTWTGTLDVSLSIKGLDLKKLISSHCSVDPNYLKLLFAGKYVKNEETLKDQGIKNNTKFIVMKTPSPVEQKEIERQEDSSNKIKKLKEAAEELAKREDGGSGKYEKHFFQLEDQNGNPINLPSEIRSCIILGLTLHEKGRAFLLNGDLHNALDFLKQADSDGFSKCPQELLNGIDNYGFLNLDIAWIYFKLEDPNFFSEAADRLLKARKHFERCHGKNLERLRLIKGGELDMALYARLEVLEGVLAFYQNDLRKAKHSLESAGKKVSELHITEEEAQPLLLLGFEPLEIRLALRACKKDLESAGIWILNRREEAALKQAHEAERRIKRKKQFTYGKTNSGKLIDLELLNGFVQMGFHEKLVLESLRQTNNDHAQALDLLVANPDLLLHQADVREQRKGTSNVKTEAPPVSQNSTEASVAKSEQSQTEENSAPQSLDQSLQDSDEFEESDYSEDDEEIATRLERKREKEEAELELIDDVAAEDPDEHLDFSLEEEFQAIQKFSKLIQQAETK